MKKILIIGATSAMAQETARLFAARGDELFLVGRSEEKLQTLVQDLRVRSNTKIHGLAADMNRIEEHKHIFNAVIERLGELDVVFIAYGILGKQEETEKDVQKMLQIFETNLLSPAAFASLAANYFETRESGTIAVITSVAGDRGRKSNYTYGAAKGGLSIFLQGLRNRLAKQSVHVLDIKPGYVDTPMTAHMEPTRLSVHPQVVAKDIVRAIDKKKDALYTPWFWRYIMLIIRHIPEKIFKKLSI